MTMGLSVREATVGDFCDPQEVGRQWRSTPIHAFLSDWVPSFRRKPESRLFRDYWTPAFAGVTTRVDGMLLKTKALQ